MSDPVIYAAATCRRWSRAHLVSSPGADRTECGVAVDVDVDLETFHEPEKFPFGAWRSTLCKRCRRSINRMLSYRRRAKP